MKYSRYNLILDNLGVLVNTFTGEMFRLDKDVMDIVKNNELPTDKNIYDDFLKSGIIISDEIDELKMIDYANKRSKYDSEILSLTILLTEKCNLKCTYCFQGGGELHQTVLTDESKMKIKGFIINKIEEYRPKILSLMLFGGEPLLDFNNNRDWLFEIKEICNKNEIGFVTSIITNGLLITPSMMKDLENLNCESIQITLDGPKESHDKRRVYKNGDGTFDKIIEKVKLVKDYEQLPNPVIRINIDKDNIENIESLLKYLKDNELDDCNYDFGIIKKTTAACASYQGTCFEDSELAAVIDSLWDKMKELGFKVYERPQKKFIFCGLYKEASFTISPTGYLYKCWEHVSDPKHLIGEINSEGGVEKWLYPYYDWMSHDPLKIEECRECIYLPACGGGCGSISYGNYESYHKQGCFKTKGVYEMQIKRLIEGKTKN